MTEFSYCTALDIDEALALLDGRAQLSDAELVDVCAFLRERGVRTIDIAKRSNCESYQISHWVRLGRQLDPEVKQLLHRRRISLGHCRAIAGLAPAAQIEAARRAITKRLSVRDLERAKEGEGAQLSSDTAQYYQQLSDRLSDTIGHPVRVTPDKSNKSSGVLAIEYSNSEMFDAICHRLGIDLESLM